MFVGLPIQFKFHYSYFITIKSLDIVTQSPPQCGAPPGVLGAPEVPVSGATQRAHDLRLGHPAGRLWPCLALRAPRPPAEALERFRGAAHFLGGCLGQMAKLKLWKWNGDDGYESKSVGSYILAITILVRMRVFWRRLGIFMKNHVRMDWWGITISRSLVLQDSFNHNGEPLDVWSHDSSSSHLEIHAKGSATRQLGHPSSSKHISGPCSSRKSEAKSGRQETAAKHTEAFKVSVVCGHTKMPPIATPKDEFPPPKNQDEWSNWIDIHFSITFFHFTSFKPFLSGGWAPIFRPGVRGGAVPSHDGHPETWHALLSGIKAWWLQRPPVRGFQGGLVKWLGSPVLFFSAFSSIKYDNMMMIDR